MVFMEATSGFILAGQVEKKRDAATRKKVIEKALKGLNVELIQVTEDEAGGLTSAVTNLLGNVWKRRRRHRMEVKTGRSENSLIPLELAV